MLSVLLALLPLVLLLLLLLLPAFEALLLLLLLLPLSLFLASLRCRCISPNDNSELVGGVSVEEEEGRLEGGVTSGEGEEVAAVAVAVADLEGVADFDGVDDVLLGEEEEEGFDGVTVDLSPSSSCFNSSSRLTLLLTSDKSCCLTPLVLGLPRGFLEEEFESLFKDPSLFLGPALFLPPPSSTLAAAAAADGSE